MSATTATLQPVPHSTGLPSLLRRAGHEVVYLLAGLPLAIVGFVVFVAGISLSAGLLVTLLGLPVMALTLSAAGGLGDLEGRRLAALGQPIPRPRPYAPPESRFWRRVLARLRDGQRWLDLLYLLLEFPLAITTFVLTITWWAIGIGGPLYVLYEPFLRSADRYGLAWLLGFDGLVADVVVNTAVGVVFLLTAPAVTHGLVAAHRGLARVTLGAMSERQLRERVESLTASRAAVVDAEAETLRRIERDIHDGPQQRLVRLSMDLQAAQRRLAEDDSPAARRLLDEAVTHVQESLSELRALSRGIAPPVLTDRGLAAALASAAGHSPIPVWLDVALEPERRLAPARESAAYFVVTEALTNAAKHSGASRIGVWVTEEADGALRVIVEDDGRGGASLGKGHGLQGLADRLAGVDGRLAVDSPEGHGTTLTAVIP
ncbi:sensor histidine kinase [Georgenia ruanii]